MKNRASKANLYAKFKPKPSTPPPVTITQEQIKRANPFDLLFKDVQPIQSIPDVIIESVEPKKRGRPRKVVNDEDSQTYKIDDEDDPHEITSWMKNRMIEDFRKAYIVDQEPLLPTLEKIAKRFRLNYAQVHSTLEGEL